jgi:hypothetical protein
LTENYNKKSAECVWSRRKRRRKQKKRRNENVNEKKSEKKRRVERQNERNVVARKRDAEGRHHRRRVEAAVEAAAEAVAVRLLTPHGQVPIRRHLGRILRHPGALALPGLLGRRIPAAVVHLDPTPPRTVGTQGKTTMTSATKTARTKENGLGLLDRVPPPVGVAAAVPLAPLLVAVAATQERKLTGSAPRGQTAKNRKR